jgi:acyl-CoA thioesterase-1
VHEVSPTTLVALAGIEAPPNMGREYTEDFREVFSRVARAQGAVELGFILDSVAGVREMNQGDRIHPTPEGHWRMARNAWPALERVIREAAGP